MAEAGTRVQKMATCRVGITISPEPSTPLHGIHTREEDVGRVAGSASRRRT